MYLNTRPTGHVSTAVQRQKAVSAYFTSKHSGFPCRSMYVYNPLAAKLVNLNFQPLEVVAR